MSETNSPLSEPDPRSLDEIFNAKPPFDPGALRAMIAEMRRMREKWQQEEVEGKKKKATKATSEAARKVEGDLWGTDEAGSS